MIPGTIPKRSRSAVILKGVILALLLAAVLGACAGIGTRPEAPRPGVAAIPVPKPARRAPGSLWSEDSHWNQMYSESAQRVPGDMLTIRVSDGLKAQMIERIASSRTPEKKEEPQGDKKPAAPSPPVAETKAQPPHAEPAVPKSLQATIREILPRGIYTIEASETIRTGNRAAVLKISGRLRERDLDDSDTVSSDALQGLAVDLSVPAGPVRAAAAASTGQEALL